MTLTVGSLFSGIGGLDLGLEWAGMETRWQVENDPFCQTILNKHWPDIPLYGDIHDLDPAELEPVDLICGGFPCQPVSLAGKREAQNDPRWLWPEFFRIVRFLRPSYVLVENVPGLASAGMGDVLGDLASIGFDAEWESFPAAAVGAPHLRYRIFIVAYPNSGPLLEQNNPLTGTSRPIPEEGPIRELHRSNVSSPLPDPISEPTRLQNGNSEPSGQGREPSNQLERTLVQPRNRATDAEGTRTDSPTNLADPNNLNLETNRRHVGGLGGHGSGQKQPGRNSNEGRTEELANPLSERLESRRNTESQGRQTMEPPRRSQMANPQRPRLERRRTQRQLGEGSQEIETRRRSQLPNPNQIRRNRRPRIFRQTGWPQPQNLRKQITHWNTDPANNPQSGMGRVANGIPQRVDRIKTLGNAVVPQQAQWIAHQIIREHHITQKNQ